MFTGVNKWILDKANVAGLCRVMTTGRQAGTEERNGRFGRTAAADRRPKPKVRIEWFGRIAGSAEPTWNQCNNEKNVQRPSWNILCGGDHREHTSGYRKPLGELSVSTNGETCLD
ncbi:hypothetical protein R1flu_000440 [Riccia fluitans]|uniref:Uncharacterized protein n=1 Tax=Riccia fluitans TaxID=41844 RepID=A0ABD1Y0G4_9MARC